MNTFTVHIYEADGVFYEGECESLIVPTDSGQYGIWAHHSNMISAIVPGTLVYRKPGDKDLLASVSSGVVRVENNDVLVLVDTAERAEDIDIERANEAVIRAREAMLQKRSILEYRMAQANLARAANRLKVRQTYDSDKQ